jgi:hypothetical protein
VRFHHIILHPKRYDYKSYLNPSHVLKKMKSIISVKLKKLKSLTITKTKKVLLIYLPHLPLTLLKLGGLNHDNYTKTTALKANYFILYYTGDKYINHTKG